uniref:J domain-containing protein n=1 Tax=viral metagenome TaxID=1070528 RepID=A0A6C0L025_9ZZZZ|tara:strand:- start:3895 stop:4497 length:603 start_codon:yes stop_codon:yes gene_type:complete
MKLNHYEVLELNIDCTKVDIKKSFRRLSLLYHPDKNDGDDEHFKRIREAYDVLYDDQERQIYNLKLIFQDIQFTEEDIQTLRSYYHQIIHSKEYKLMKLLYSSIPREFKERIWKKYKQKKNKDKQIIVAPKSIDITELYNDEHINLCITYDDYRKNVLKVIHVHTKNGYYYLYIRGQKEDIRLNNNDCYLTIHFFIINNK